MVFLRVCHLYRGNLKNAGINVMHLKRKGREKIDKGIMRMKTNKITADGWTMTTTTKVNYKISYIVRGFFEKESWINFQKRKHSMPERCEFCFTNFNEIDADIALVFTDKKNVVICDLCALMFQSRGFKCKIEKRNNNQKKV